MKERIDILLVKKGYFDTRQKAKYAIENECVYVNGKNINKVSKIFEEDCEIEITKEILPFVSRGGLKLNKAVKVFGFSLEGKNCLDIGASTGGFTDCMLQNGAKKVYAMDVGHHQLNEKLLNNSKVVNLEGTNIKNVDQNQFEKVDFISIDVSFISLLNVLEKAYQLLNLKGEMVILIKPQFEAGQEFLNKNGVVKDKKVHVRVIEKVLLFASSVGLKINKIDYSPIKGPAGNIEYLAYMEKSKEVVQMDLFKIREEIKKIVETAHTELK